MYVVIVAFSTLLLPPYISNTSRQFVHTSPLSEMQLRLVSNLSNVYHSCEDTRGISFEGRCCVEMEATNHRQQNHW